MQSKIRRKSNSLIDAIKASPKEYQFEQTVRIIERLSVRNKSANRLIGRFNPPVDECIRFVGKPTLAYLDSDIQSTPYVISNETNYRIQFNGLGLLGSNGVLPYHYTEFLLQRQKQKDDSFAQFIDLLNHRFVSLMYRANTKYAISNNIELSIDKPFDGEAGDNFTRIIHSLVGIGTNKLQNRLSIHDHSLNYYSGLLIPKVRNEVGLKKILSSYFRLPVKIEQFIGQWQNLLDDVKTRLSTKEFPKGQNAQLGISAMLGSRAWVIQSKIKIVIGPLSREEMNLFAPGTTTFKTMNEIVQLYLGIDQDYEFIMEMRRDDLPKQLVLSRDNPPIMGWNAWIGSTDDRKYNLDKNSVRIKISARNN